MKLVVRGNKSLGYVIYIATDENSFELEPGETKVLHWYRITSYNVCYTKLLRTLANEVLAINANNGSIVWKNTSEVGLWSQPVYNDGAVYYGDTAGKIFA